MTHPEIIQKVRALFDLGKNNPSEEEATRALEMASRMMLKHSITQFDIAASIAVKYGDRINKDRDYYTFLSILVAKLYGTSTVGNREGFNFVGRQDMLMACVDTFKFLAEQIEGLYKINLISGMTKSDRARFRKHFKRACTLRLLSRVEEIVAAQINPEDTTGTDLVVIRDKLDAEVSDFLEDRGVKVVNISLRVDRLNEGARRGHIAGDHVKLHRRVN